MGRERSNIGTGVVLITLGLIFLADRQGYGHFGQWWPLLMIVGGLSTMIFSQRDAADGRECRSRFSGLWLVFVGVLFLLHQNNMLRINESWPLFIVAAGVGIMFGGPRRRRRSSGDATHLNGGQPS
jgi:hypothetical protein